MKAYFEPRDPETHKFKGKLPTSLPTILHEDLRTTGQTLKNIQDLEYQEQLAQHREEWEEQTHKIIHAQVKQWKKKRERELFKKKFIGEFAVTFSDFGPQDFL